MAVAIDGRARTKVIADGEGSESFGVDPQQGDIGALVSGENFDDREETSVGGHHAHRLGGFARDHVVIGGDDPIGINDNTTRKGAMPTRALVAFVGAGNEYRGSRGDAVGLFTIEQLVAYRSLQANACGRGAFDLSQAGFLVERRLFALR